MQQFHDRHAWKECTAFEPARSYALDRVSSGHAKPLSHVDVNKKEWIICLLPPIPIVSIRMQELNDVSDDASTDSLLSSCGDGDPVSASSSPPPQEAQIQNESKNRELWDCDSFLYDIENDKYVPFIENYQSDINEKFNIEHYTQRGTMSFVIDNDNDILYWLDSSQDENFKLPKQRSLIALDIKDLTNVQLLYQKIIPCDIDDIENINNFAGFIEYYNMLLVENTIQFIENESDWLQHYQFDLITKKFSLEHNNIHSNAVSRVTSSKIENVIKNLKITDWIDVKDKHNKFYLCQVLEIVYKSKDTIDDDDEKNSSTTRKKEKAQELGLELEQKNDEMEMRVKVHFDGWSNKWDEWLRINVDSHSIKNIACDCTTYCVHLIERNEEEQGDDNGSEAGKGGKKGKWKQHMIAMPRSQSTYWRTLCGTSSVYLEKYGQMMVFGHNNKTANVGCWHGIYCKRMNNYKHSTSLINYSDNGSGNENNDYNNYSSRYKNEKKYFELIVLGFVHQFEMKLEGLIKARIPMDLCNIILKYYFIPSDKEWQAQEECYNDNKFESLVHPYCGYVSIYNGELYDIFLFGGRKILSHIPTQYIIHIQIYNDDKYKNDKNQIGYKIETLKNIKSPFFGWTTNYQLYWKDDWHAVFAEQTRTVHLIRNNHFETPKHVSIALSELLNDCQVRPR